MASISQFDGSVNVGCDMDFERRWWRIERWLWVVMTILIVGGLSGVFGRGPISKTTVSQLGVPLSLEYERLARFETPSILTLWVSPDAMPPAGNELKIHVNRELMNTIKIGEIAPKPLRVESVEEGMVFSFLIQPEDGRATIVFPQQSAQDGPLNGQVSLVGMAPLRFKQFVYP